MDRIARWRSWFAWYPVRLTHDPGGFLILHQCEPRIVWLEWIERAQELNEGYRPAPHRPLPWYRAAPDRGRENE